MNTKNNIIITGSLLLTAGALTSLMSHDFSPIVRYVHAGVLGSAGVFALITGQESKVMNGRSMYYSGHGLIVITLIMSLGIFGTTEAAFVSMLGFFQLLLGITGFAFAQQLLVDHESDANLAGVKFLVAGIMAIGGTWILTIPELYTDVAFIISGGLFVLTGLALIHLGRRQNIEKEIVHPDF